MPQPTRVHRLTDDSRHLEPSSAWRTATKKSRLARQCFRILNARTIGPTITLTPVPNSSVVRSGNDLNPLRDIDFSRPDADEVKLHEAIMKSEGLPRQKAVQPK